MVGKVNLAVFESSNISKTGMVTPIKIVVHAQYIDLYLPDFFEPIWSFLKLAISPKLELGHPSKLVCMLNTLTSTCMNFLCPF